MPIKRDYQRNGQLHISTTGHEVISLCQAQGTNLASLYLLLHLQYFHIFTARNEVGAR